MCARVFSFHSLAKKNREKKRESERQIIAFFTGTQFPALFYSSNSLVLRNVILAGRSRPFGASVRGCFCWGENFTKKR